MRRSESVTWNFPVVSLQVRCQQPQRSLRTPAQKSQTAQTAQTVQNVDTVLLKIIIISERTS